MNSNRHYPLDWLRVVATAGVFIFHSGAAYMPGDWHLNAPTKSFAITIWNSWLLLWLMPLLFLIAGASTHFSMQKRSAGRLLRERLDRLLIPLIFGILVIAPPQVYIERISRGQFAGSFWTFYPHYFDGWYLAIGGPGNFAWMGLHLWFLLLLLLMTVVALPLLQWLQTKQQLIVVHPWTQRLRQPLWLSLLALPVAVIEWLWGNVGLGGWNLLTYPLYFLYGAFLLAQPTIGDHLRNTRWWTLVVAVLTTTLLFRTIYADGMVAFGQYPAGWQRILHAVSGWFWVVTALGWAYRSSTRTNRFLTQATEAILPFYILHQTVIILVGYWVNRLPITVGMQYSMVIVFSLFVILTIYAALIHPLSWLRYAFGMKAVRRRNTVMNQPLVSRTVRQ